MPKVSVIIPIYGVEKYIERCVRSLMEQTLDSIEYLFINDCTPDRSIDILKQVLNDYPQRKSQVVIHQMEQNSGQAAVRKWGMENVKGDYVIHCDSDDWVDKDIYRLMYESAISEDADIVVCDYLVHNGENALYKMKGCHTTDIKTFIEDLMFQKTQWSLWNKLIRRETYSGNIAYPKGDMGEDMAILSQIISICGKMAYVDTPLYYYFRNPDSITNKLSTRTIIRNFENVKSNTDVVLDYYNGNKDKHIATGLLYLQYNAKAHLFPIIHKKKFRKLFMDTYPHLYRKILFDSCFPIVYKLKYLMSLLGLYPRKVNN